MNSSKDERLINTKTPTIAVITPYYDEPLEYLRQCHESVTGQTINCLHVFIADGKPREELNNWNCDHIILPRSHADVGSTPRAIGSFHAIGLNIDCMLFLDADNWYAPSHVETLVAIRKEKQAAIVSSNRMLCRMDGTIMGKCPITNLDQFVDTSCMLIGHEAFSLIHQWALMPAYGHLIGDRIFWYHICQSGLSRSHSDEPSVFYRCGKAGMYRLMGEDVPPGVMPRPDYEGSHRLWIEDGNPSLYQSRK